MDKKKRSCATAQLRKYSLTYKWGVSIYLTHETNGTTKPKTCLII